MIVLGDPDLLYASVAPILPAVIVWLLIPRLTPIDAAAREVSDTRRDAH